MQFYDASKLWLFCIIPGLLIFYVLVFKARKRALERFGNIELLKRMMPAVRRSFHFWQAFLIISGTFFVVLALARPQWGTIEEMIQRKGLDIIIAIDTSLSMLAEDIKPNRMQEAKHKLKGLIEKLKGDRVGIVAFAGSAFVQCPLTLDYGAAKLFLDAIDVGFIPKPGTAIGEAIRVATNAFVKTERKHKVLILITDGEDTVGDPVKAAEEAAKEGIRIYTIGLGSTKGEPIPLFDQNGNRIGFKRDKNGEIIMSKLDEVTLQKIALATNGGYYRATSEGLELSSIFDEIQKMEKKELASKKFILYEDRYQYFLGIAIALFTTTLLIPERKKVKIEWQGRFK